MIKIDFDIQWLFFLLPVFLYAETHFKIWNIFSRYFKREPEIVADVPHRLGPGKKLPVFLCIKDADRFPVELDTVHIEMLNDAQKITLFEENFSGQKIAEPLWYNVFECDVDSVCGFVKINVKISYHCYGAVKTCDNDNYALTSHEPFTVFVDNSPRPKLSGWAFGDMHTHSDLTSDQVEFGAPLKVSAAMARALELDFFASADHSYDLDDREDDYLVNDPALPKWKKLWRQVTSFNQKNQDLVIIPGEELSVGNAKNQNVHQLIFNNKKFWPGWGDSAEKWFRTKPQHRIKNVLPHLEEEALSFAAHPMIEPPLLQKLLIRRGIWTDEDLSLPGLHGAQFWSGDKNHFLNVGLKKWIELLLAGHKLTLIAGSDAHGNFNRFRQIGTPHFTMREEQHEIFGASLTGVKIDGELSLDNLLDGLRRGRVMVTDGPVGVFSFRPSAFSFEQDKKGNTRKVDSRTPKAKSEMRTTISELQFSIGDVANLPPDEIHISVSSTPSYGDLHRVELVLGSISAKKETRKQIDLPSGCYDFSESVKLKDCPRPGYMRLEVESRIGDRFYHCFTNPIYIH